MTVQRPLGRAETLYTTVLSTACVSLCYFFSAPAHADLALANAKNCTSCHAVDRKIVGPAFHDIALKYRNNKAAIPHLTQKVIKGGGGVWGVLQMPANQQVNEAEAKRLVEWVLTQ